MRSEGCTSFPRFLCRLDWGDVNTVSPHRRVSGCSLEDCCSLKALFLVQDLSATKLSSISMTSNTNLSNMRRMVEQLKLEASVERIKVKKLPGALPTNLLLKAPTSSIPPSSASTAMLIPTRCYNYWLFYISMLIFQQLFCKVFFLWF